MKEKLNWFTTKRSKRQIVRYIALGLFLIGIGIFIYFIGTIMNAETTEYNAIELLFYLIFAPIVGIIAGGIFMFIFWSFAIAFLIASYFVDKENDEIKRKNLDWTVILHIGLGLIFGFLLGHYLNSYLAFLIAIVSIIPFEMAIYRIITKNASLDSPHMVINTIATYLATILMILLL